MTDRYDRGYPQALARIKELEAKLAKAEGALRKLNRRQDCLETFDAVVDEIVTAALKELEDKTDD